jgi:hypothetical protein
MAPIKTENFPMENSYRYPTKILRKANCGHFSEHKPQRCGAENSTPFDTSAALDFMMQGLIDGSHSNAAPP